MIDKTLRARVALGELAAMGLTVDDLAAVAGQGAGLPVGGPTVADYVPVVVASYKPRSRRTYNSYWRLLVEQVGPACELGPLQACQDVRPDHRELA